MFHFKTKHGMIALLVLILTSFGAQAHSGHEPVRFMGAHIGGGLLGGTGLLTHEGYNEQLPSWAVGGFARVSSVLQLIDIQLEYLYRQHKVEAESTHVVIRGHGVRLSTNLHPFFVHLFKSNRWWMFVSGIYVQFGAGLEYVSAGPEGDASSSYDPAPTVHAGGGWDIPLDDPTDGGGFWLGFNYRYAAVFLDMDWGRGSDVHGHWFLMSLGYRSNNLDFMRIERPTELKFH